MAARTQKIRHFQYKKLHGLNFPMILHSVLELVELLFALFENIIKKSSYKLVYIHFVVIISPFTIAFI